MSKPKLTKNFRAEEEEDRRGEFACKVPVILVRFQRYLNFDEIFLKIHGYQISCKSTRWEPSFTMRADSRTETGGQTWGS